MGEPALLSNQTLKFVVAMADGSRGESWRRQASGSLSGLGSHDFVIDAKKEP
jgi:hypothetical protein